MAPSASCCNVSRDNSFIIPDTGLRAMLSARLSYFDTTICVYSSALMR